MKSLAYILIAVTYLSSDNLNKTSNDYPSIIWLYEIRNSENGEPIKGIVCEREINYDYTKQAWILPPLEEVKFLEKRNEKLEENTAEYQRNINEIELLKHQWNELLEKSKKSEKDTATIGNGWTQSLKYPVLSYKVNLLHPDYKPLLISKKFDESEYSIVIDAYMERK